MLSDGNRFNAACEHWSSCANVALCEELLERLQIVLVPSGAEVVVAALGEGAVVEDDCGFGASWLEFEAYQRVEAGGPVGGTPCLDDALIGDEFDVATDDHSAKHGEGAAGFGVDLGWSAGACG